MIVLSLSGFVQQVSHCDYHFTCFSVSTLRSLLSSPLFPLLWWEGLVTRHLSDVMGTSPGLEFHHVLPQGGIHGSSTPNPCFVYFAVHVSWPEFCLILNLGSCPDADLVSFPRPTMAQFWRKVSYRWLLSALLSPFQVSEITGDWHYSEDGLGP